MEWDYRAFITVSLYSLHLQCTKRWFGSLSILKDEDTEVQWIRFRTVEPLHPSFPLSPCSLLLTFQPLLDFFFPPNDSLNLQLSLEEPPSPSLWSMLEIWLSHWVMILLDWLSDFCPLPAVISLSELYWFDVTFDPETKTSPDIFFFIFLFLSLARRFCQFWQSLRSRSCQECFECKY